MRTKVIAFGGWMYSIAKWLPLRVEHHKSPVWGFTERWCRDFAATLQQPTTLIGFSEGANAAMRIAAHSPMVTTAVVHSCEDKRFAFNPNCYYHFFCTLQDTTPTFDGTIDTAHRAHIERQDYTIKFLEFVPFDKPTWFESSFLEPRSHIFHNVLPHLSSLGIQ